METVSKKRNFLIVFLFILGLLFTTLGIVLTVGSFRHEVLDNKYVIKTVTDYNSVKPKLESGQMAVTKDIAYLSDGIYKITFKNYSNFGDNSELLEKDSAFNIVDLIGDSYILLEDSLVMNGKKITLADNIYFDNDISISYNNNTIEFKLPADSLKKNNEIEMKIKLNDMTTGVRHMTSHESYFNFIPSSSNNYYQKRTAQSYVINGSAYIVLSNK